MEILHSPHFMRSVEVSSDFWPHFLQDTSIHSLRRTRHLDQSLVDPGLILESFPAPQCSPRQRHRLCSDSLPPNRFLVLLSTEPRQDAVLYPALEAGCGWILVFVSTGAICTIFSFRQCRPRDLIFCCSVLGRAAVRPPISTWQRWLTTHL